MYIRAASVLAHSKNQCSNVLLLLLLLANFFMLDREFENCVEGGLFAGHMPFLSHTNDDSPCSCPQELLKDPSVSPCPCP